jgi:hypothetical protein
MDYMLKNYGIDEEVTRLINEREIIVTPMTNA